jgi:HK97 family phage prohead protease
MTWWRRVRAALFGAPVATFSESAPRPIDRVIWEMAGRNPARVSREQALTVPAVVKGRNLICSISTLPLVQLNARNERIRLPLLEQIDPDVPNVVTLAQTLEDLLFESIAWWEITAWDAHDYPIYARRVDPGAVSLDPPANARTPAFLPGGYDPRGASVWIDGREVPASRVIRFDSPNPAVLSSGARAIRRAILLDKAASLYADDPRPLDYFTPSPDAEEIDDDEVVEILAEWKAARKQRSTAWIPRAMQYHAVDAPSPQELQLVELAERAALDIANMLGVDPEDLGVSTTSRTYANVIDRRRDKINDVLSPYMRAVTDRLSMGDVTRRGYRVLFDLKDYMKSNPTEQWSVFKTAHDLGAITLDEIRYEDQRPPLPPEARPKPPPPATDDDDEESEVDQATVDASREAMYAELMRAGVRLNADEEGKLQFADIPVMQLSVDSKRRIIEGIALPYGTTASKYGIKLQFLKGALKWTSVNRVKLLRDHAMSQPLGVATSLTDTSVGLRVRFKVARGAAGDEALALAEDGVLDGLSVGVDFSVAEDTEMSDDGVMLVRRADLREVSLTAMPAFDDARVTKVAASRTEGTSTMEECATCGQRHAPGVACPTTPQTDPAPAGLNLNADQITALLSQPGALAALTNAARPQPAQPATPAGGLTLSAEQVQGLIKSGGLGVLLGVPQLTPAPSNAEQEPERQVVNPTRNKATVQASVTEPLPYRFDRAGNLIRGVTYDFSTDLVAGQRGDGEAMERATKFVKSQAALFENYDLARAQFDTDTTDVAALNPNRNRPDMYVDQKDFTYPIWEAISKGTLADIVPFVLPKFATATGMVGAHTEGVEPTPGTFTATSQTITPSAVSGKMEITREAWDAGGNPQLSGIVWRQMVKAWYEALEASAVTLLDSLSPTQITLTTAAQDDVLVGEIEAAIAALQFVRGGMRMRDLFIQIDLYKALAAAVDADGRKLLPRLGAVNANGTVSELFADLDIAGLRGRPAWALAATGTVAASSYLFDRSDVHGWASAPNRLQFEYQAKSVEIGIWGYKALANTDLTGVREVVYDPA